MLESFIMEEGGEWPQTYFHITHYKVKILIFSLKQQKKTGNTKIEGQLKQI